LLLLLPVGFLAWDSCLIALEHLLLLLLLLCWHTALAFTAQH